MEKTTRENFNGLSLFGMGGVTRVSLSGDHGPESLAEEMVQNWIPFYECHKCGWAETCGFVQWTNRAAHRARDIRCGVVAQMVTNHMAVEWPRFVALDLAAKQHFLDASFHFTRFLYDSHVLISGYFDEDIVGFFGTEGSPALFSIILDVRDHLDRAAASMSKVPGHMRARGLLLVEGESEEHFLSILRDNSQLLWFKDLHIMSYGGGSKAAPTKLEMLWAYAKRAGRTLFIQGDADGKEAAIFRALIDRGIVARDHAFQFTRDFENGLPADVLLNALVDMNRLTVSQAESLAPILDPSREGYGETIYRTTGLDISADKVALAEAAARVVVDCEMLNEEELGGSELWEFLKFVARIPK